MQGYNSYFVGESKVLVHNCEVKFVSKKVARGEQPVNSGKIEDIPGIGHDGKLDGLIPTRGQWSKYSSEDLNILKSDLIKSINKRTADLKTKGAETLRNEAELKKTLGGN